MKENILEIVVGTIVIILALHRLRTMYNKIIDTNVKINRDIKNTTRNKNKRIRFVDRVRS